MAVWQNYFQNRNSNTKEINKKKCEFKVNSCFFSAATDSENIIIQILYGKGQIKIWPEVSLSEQEPTFNQFQTGYMYMYHRFFG